MSASPPPCGEQGGLGCGAQVVPLYQGLIFLVPIIFTFTLCLLLFLMYARSRHYYRRHASAQRLREMLANAQAAAGNGLDAATMATFPTTLFSSLKGSANAAKVSDDLQCPVCLGEYQDTETLRLLPCHAFHQECIDAWFANHATCPICRLSYLPASQRGDATSAGAEAARGGEHLVAISAASGEGGPDTGAAASPQPLAPEGPAPLRPLS